MAFFDTTQIIRTHGSISQNGQIVATDAPIVFDKNQMICCWYVEGKSSKPHVKAILNSGVTLSIDDPDYMAVFPVRRS